MVQPNSFYYKEEPGIRNVSTREKFTIIFDTTSTSGVTYEGRCRLPLDQALQRFDESIWQLWRTGTKAIEVDSVVYSSGVHTIEGISERSFNEVWDDRVAIFGDTVVPYVNVFSQIYNGIDDYVDLGAIGNWERTQAFSISVWFKTSQATVAHFINRIQDVAPFRGWQFYKFTTQKLTFSLISNASTNSIQVNGDSIVNDDDWHHAVMTYDGSTDAVGVKMYLDMNPEVVTIVTDTLTATTLHVENALLGKRSDDIGFYDGYFDEPAIYDRALSAADVTAIYNAGVPNNLLALDSGDDILTWLQFTQDDIDNFPTIADHSGNTNDATAVNMVSGSIQGEIP